MPQPFHILFLCTGNSARSILAESILNHRAKGNFVAHSAGSHPTGVVNPHALKLLESYGLLTSNLRSKSWDEFSQPGAPHLDFVFTVCDNAALETCPFWPGQPMTAHWGVPDPAAITGTPDQIARAFRDAYVTLDRRINLFLSLPLSSLNSFAIKSHITKIGTA